MVEVKKRGLGEILAPIAENLEAVEDTLSGKLMTGVELIDETTHHLFRSGGKRIRAAIAILVSGLKDSTIPQGVIDLAAAAEMVHAATLVHDDIIDQATFRRGDVTVDNKWGQKIAVLAGDLMYTEALNISVEDGNPSLFPVLVKGTRDMVKGELYQLQYSNVISITKERYLEIIRLKTASFLAACTEIGAIKAGFAPKVCENLYKFGEYMGYAFQIVDDTLDFIDDDSGKDSGNDFKDGKVTLPFLYLLETLSDEDAKLYREYSLSPNDNNWQIVKKSLIDSGALDYSISEAKKYIVKAQDILDQFENSMYKSILMELGDFFVDRSF